MSTNVALQDVDERRSHLIDANRIRMARATLKRDLAAMSCREGRTELIERIEAWDSLVLSLRVREALCAVRGYGPRIARRYAEHISCSQDDRLADLSDAQLLAFVELVRVPKRLMPSSGKTAL